jgi:hypothetical protein
MDVRKMASVLSGNAVKKSSSRQVFKIVICRPLPPI